MVRREMMSFGRNILLAAIITLVVANLYAQGGKNILRIRFDQIVVKEPTQFVTLNVWWSVEGSKPYTFRGFDCRFAYEKHQVAPTSAVKIGTASAHASIFHFERDVYPYQGEARLQVLTAGNMNLDLSKPVLFRLVFTTKAPLYDTVVKDYRGLMEAFRFDVIGDGIDSVQIEDGWIQYDVPLPNDPPPLKRRNITVSTDSASVQDDTTLQIPVRVTALDSAEIRYGNFSFTYDTTVLSFISAAPSPLVDTLLVEAKPGIVAITFMGADTSKALTGSGELLTLTFRTHKREDTICTELTDTAFFALNDSALTDTIFLTLGAICVFGEKEDVGVVRDPASPALFIVQPNPATETIKFMTDETRSSELIIWNVLGEVLEQYAMTGTLELDVRRYPAGTYRAVVMCNGRIVGQEQFIIIH